RAKLTDYDIKFIEPELSWAQELVLNAKMDGARALLEVFGPDRDTAALAQLASPLSREVARLKRLSVRNRLYAYCFCTAADSPVAPAPRRGASSIVRGASSIAEGPAARASGPVRILLPPSLSAQRLLEEVTRCEGW